MTDYGAALDTSVIFSAAGLVNTFGDVVAAHGLRQLRIAETEKYAHVTFFFNGGEEKLNIERFCVVYELVSYSNGYAVYKYGGAE